MGLIVSSRCGTWSLCGLYFKPGKQYSAYIVEETTDSSIQWEAYNQLCDEQNAALLKETLADSRKLHGFVSISLEELAVEVAVCTAPHS